MSLGWKRNPRFSGKDHSSVVVPIFKGKGDVMNCGLYRRVKLLEHGIKIVGEEDTITGKSC